MSTIAIHQPNYLPWEGFFHKMGHCDTFVFLDNVQYSHNSFTNRTLIKDEVGKKWLSFSIKHNSPQLIKDVKFADFKKDRDKHLVWIKDFYGEASGFQTVYPIICNMFSGDWENMSEFNIKLIKDLMAGLPSQPKIEVASQYDFKESSTDLLIEICKHFGADTYLSGCGAKDYQEEKKFKKAGITLEYSNFEQLPYHQQWGGEFIPGLSIIDRLLNKTYFTI